MAVFLMSYPIFGSRTNRSTRLLRVNRNKIEGDNIFTGINSLHISMGLD
jgi:hypothetical protein